MSFILSVVAPCVAFLNRYDEYYYADCRYADCHYSECRGALYIARLMNCLYAYWFWNFSIFLLIYWTFSAFLVMQVLKNETFFFTFAESSTTGGHFLLLSGTIFSPLLKSGKCFEFYSGILKKLWTLSLFFGFWRNKHQSGDVLKLFLPLFIFQNFKISKFSI